MTVNQGTSTDMSTISGEDSKSAIEFVEDPNAQNFDLSYEYRVDSGGGMMANEYPKDVNQVEDASKKNLPKASPRPPQLPASQGSEAIKSLQRYFANPSPAMRQLLPGIRYVGKIDGNAGEMTLKIANEIESLLSSMLGTNKVRGIVLRTSPNDVEGALSKVAEYKHFISQETPYDTSRDERIYQLAKILIKSR